MKDNIIIDYDPFAMESRVVLFRNGKQEVIKVCSDVPSLTSQILDMAYSTNTYSIKVHSPYAFYSEIQRAIEQIELAKYSSNKIIVEPV